MKILLLTDRMNTGGAETHIAQLAVELSAMGHEVAILSSGGATATALEQRGIRQIVLPLDTRNPFRRCRLRRRLIALQKRERFDVLHAHARFPAALMRGIGNRFGGCEIVTVHAKFQTFPFSRRLCYWGERTVAVSEDLRAYVCDVYGVPAERVRVIPNGIDCNRFFPPPQPRNGETVSVLFASRLDEDCSLGAELLCRIAPALVRRFPSLRIGIAGGGRESARIARLATESNRIIGTPVIVLHGAVENMPALLRQQDILIGVSRAAMEGAACGCAVILCGNEGYAGLLTAENFSAAALSNFCCRDCPPADFYRLQRDLLFLLERPEERLRAAVEVRTELVSRFGSERMGRETLTLYHRALRLPHAHTLTVGGYFGCGNLGDDAILLGLLEGLHEYDPRIRVLALTGNPRRDRRRFGIPCWQRKHPLAVLCAFLRSDVFLCGGGSLLQNVTSRRSLRYYLHLLAFARRMGVRPVLYAAGIGPLYGKQAKRRVRRTLLRADYISVRDAESASFLEANGIPRDRLHVGADPALLMPLPPPSRMQALLHQNGIDVSQRYLCLVLRHAPHASDSCRTVLAAVRLFCARHALMPVLLVFDAVRDASALRDAQQKLGGILPTLREPADAAAFLSQAVLTVTMRLHALILATAVGTPAIGIPTDANDPKMASFARSVGQRVILPEDLTVAGLVEALEETMNERDALRPILNDAVADLRKKAKKDLENIVTMIYNSGREQIFKKR